MKNCIYKIVNKENNKFYLGSSNNYKKRWQSHKLNLRKNKHHSIHLQRAWNKYGESSFSFEIIEFILPENQISREQFYLDSLKPYNTDIGYNICTIAGAFSRNPMSEETREKQRSRMLGIKNPMYGKRGKDSPIFGRKHNSSTLKLMREVNTGINNHNYGRHGKDNARSKKLVQKTKSGTIIKTWDNMTEVYNALGYSKGNISNCCNNPLCKNGRTRTYKNSIWEFV